MMEAYIEHLKRVRCSHQAAMLAPLSDGLVRHALTVMAYASYLCPWLRPAVQVTLEPPTATFVWRWRSSLLVIMVPEPGSPFEEEGPEPVAFYTDLATGEVWSETGFCSLGSASFHPVFPARVEQKLLEAHSSVSEQPQPEPTGHGIPGLRFVRLFPELADEFVHVDDDPIQGSEPSRPGSRRERLFSWLSGIWTGIAPAVQEAAVSVIRDLIQDTLKRWRNRRRYSHSV